MILGEPIVQARREEKAKTQPAQKATVDAARKLSAEIWKMLTFEVPYSEEDADLTDRKEKRMRKVAEDLAPAISSEQLEALADRLSGKADVLQVLKQEAGGKDQEVDDAG